MENCDPQQTQYSIDEITFDPKRMVKIRMISDLDHGVDFVKKTVNPWLYNLQSDGGPV